MQDYLSEYQKAALQVMGISVWTQKQHNVSQERHSSQWLNENKHLVSDIETAIEHVLGIPQASIDFIWMVAEDFSVSVTEKTISAPATISNAEAALKRQLWQELQQQLVNAN